ncbi:Thiamine biosynthesis lipoprotein ApbE precursor [Gimesia maris]|uniref:DUF2271 domain-containing protein n=1 Tax=Gimesia maris TaxID=122 RepID=UPI001188A0AC|nr:DUF2271 domain-containing protein [Gimesia maris]QDU13176.1 Thiamine biosynthesis lipoprotein ApbE precursor [Gimesia maris]
MNVSKQLLLAVIVQASLVFSGQANAGEYRFQHEHVLGTSLELRVNADTAERAEQAETAALKEIDRLEKVLSRHNPASELMQWQNGSKQSSLSKDLLIVLNRAEKWRQLTGGAFDVRAGAFSELWKQAAQQQQLPSEEERRQIAVTLTQAPWNVDVAGTIQRNDTLAVSLDALGKGYILDAVCRKIQTECPGVTGLVINIGGDLRKVGAAPVEIAIANPADVSENAAPLMTFRKSGEIALATSGGYQRYFEIAGRKYSHLIDPRTGFSAEQIQSASVIAATAMDADAAATVVSVLGTTAGLALIESLEGFECLLLTNNGTVQASSGWPAGNADWQASLVAAEVNRNANEKSTAGLNVDFTLKRPEGGRYRRPYVAVWLEDEDGFPVKTALLWMQTKQPGPRWHRDLTRWYRNDRFRKLAENKELIGTISAATRGPGQYQARFDGTDNQGKPLPHGKYTLYIEAAREHGTYQIIRKPVELRADPISKQGLEENVEIGNVSFEYIPWATK